MDRLKQFGRVRSLACTVNLHSNMDRLKRQRDGYRKRDDHIYIPIWID